MAGQTCCASDAGIKAIRASMKRNAWTQTELAKECGFSRSTLNKILKGAPVRRDNWKELSHLLDLELEHIIEPDKSGLDIEAEIEAVVTQLREHVAPQIKKRCGVMRVLDMTQPINSTAIYTDVNILERVTSKTRADLDRLMQGMDAENFDRFCLGEVRQKRVPGLKALYDHRLLMILGKPGAGKTTFLKRLAMWCRAGKQGLEDKVPIFVTLKEFADDRHKHETLLDFVTFSYDLKESGTDLKALLKARRVLVLLDGLDEVQNAEHERVLTAICEFGRQYDQNQIVITCRIAAREYIFEHFTEVEVADFQDEQIQDFASKWFLTHSPEKVDEAGNSTLGKLFWQELEQHQPVKELATNPLLLTLLCLEFGEDCGFPSSRAELYERGLDILFTKWDGTRQIKRDQIYKKLPTIRKKALLAQLAWSTFEQGNYFFKQSVAEQQIHEYIQNLPGASQDEEALMLDSSSVLRSIEAQHGLLTQRATGIYSFSHLSFQEYFSASRLASKPELTNRLLTHLGERRWREVYLLTAEKLDSADSFLINLKKSNDSTLVGKEVVNKFLRTQVQKSFSTSSEGTAYGMMAFWGTIGFSTSRDPISTRSSMAEIIGELNLAAKSSQTLMSKQLEGKLTILHSPLVVARAKILEKANKVSSFNLIYLVTALNLASYMVVDLDIVINNKSSISIQKILRKSIEQTKEPQFSRALRHLQIQLEKSGIDMLEERFLAWWETNGPQWTEDLRQVLIKHRNIGHVWEFTIQDLKSLKTYYYNSALIIDCLNSECYVSREVRQHIEDTLLVPPD